MKVVVAVFNKEGLPRDCETSTFMDYGCSFPALADTPLICGHSGNIHSVVIEPYQNFILEMFRSQDNPRACSDWGDVQRRVAAASTHHNRVIDNTSYNFHCRYETFAIHKSFFDIYIYLCGLWDSGFTIPHAKKIPIPMGNLLNKYSIEWSENWPQDSRNHSCPRWWAARCWSSPWSPPWQSRYL